MKDKVLELIEVYDKYIDMLQEDILMYESAHGNDAGHENIYKGEQELLNKINELESYFEGII